MSGIDDMWMFGYSPVLGKTSEDVIEIRFKVQGLGFED